MKLQAGMTVKPGLVLTRHLGRGGMGSIWVARHEALDAEVAVKFLSAALLENEGAVQRFSFEAAATARIKSPHAVQVHDHGILGDEVPYIVMELLEGRDLGELIAAKGALEVSDVTKVLVQLARVLVRAHELGIVHRDIKPDNVFLLADYGELFLKVIDFGIAKHMTEQTGLTQTGLIVGTPDYMAPEQFAPGKQVGPAADIWGVVAVTYHALTGQKPFPGETLPAVIHSIDRGVYQPPFATYGRGTPGLDAVFARAFHRDPTRRYQTFEDLVLAWKGATGGSLRPRLNSSPFDTDELEPIVSGGTLRISTDLTVESARISDVTVESAGLTGDTRGDLPIHRQAALLATAVPKAEARPAAAQSKRLIVGGAIGGALLCLTFLGIYVAQAGRAAETPEDSEPGAVHSPTAAQEAPRVTPEPPDSGRTLSTEAPSPTSSKEANQAPSKPTLPTSTAPSAAVTKSQAASERGDATPASPQPTPSPKAPSPAPLPKLKDRGF